MILRYTYITESRFEPSVSRHFFKLRALPCENEFQQVIRSQLKIEPDCAICHSIDGQGNAVQWGSYDQEHPLFRVSSTGLVLQRAPYFLHGIPAPYYKTPTRLTSCCQAMQRLVAGIVGNSSVHPLQAFDVAHSLMHIVYHYITYMPGVTSVSTTAEDVWHSPQGVCQDYAHLMIALCRCVGIHARYVNGLIEGQGETHAWVEVSDGTLWRGFDPTNDKIIDWGYIKIAHGRDADDCPTNRGRFFGWTMESMTVRASIEKLEIIG